MPTWEDFRAEYAQEVPTPTPAPSFELTDNRLIHFIRARSARWAGGLDGWATREAKDLPDALLCLFAQVLRCMQRSPGPKPRATPQGCGTQGCSPGV